MDKEKKLALKRKLNMKLYPIYRMISMNVLFYDAVKVLFLTQVKGISNANVVFLETIYAFFKMFLQIPMTPIVTKLGKRKSIILGNILLATELIITLLSTSYMHLILAQLISSLAWSFKSIAECPLLSASIPEAKSKNKIFSKIDSKGHSKFCYISAIATLMSGFLYEINPYLPISLALAFVGVSIIISFNFMEIEEKEKIENKTIKESIIEVKEDFKFIFKSPRLKSLLLMQGFMWGIICLFGTYQNTLLKDINVPAKYIGIILAALDIIQGISSTKADKFNTKYKNKSLTYLSLRMTIGIGIAGGVVVLGLSRIPQLAIIIFTYVIRLHDKGVFQIIKKNYMSNFMTPDILTKIYSANSVICSVFRMSISFIGSMLLNIVTIEYAMVIVGIIFSIVTLIFSKYMKTRIGLKLEEYTEKDIVKV